jgi:hypothetical protein
MNQIASVEEGAGNFQELTPTTSESESSPRRDFVGLVPTSLQTHGGVSHI